MLATPLFNKTVFFPSFLSEGGEMAECILSHDWSSSSLGPMSHWPQSLQTTLSIMLHSRLPMFLCWGVDRVVFYNDAYIPLLPANAGHPWALGRKGPLVWAGAWHLMEPFVDRAIIVGGHATLENQHISVNREGYEEQACYTCHYTPVTMEEGYRGGVLVSFFEMEASRANR